MTTQPQPQPTPQPEPPEATAARHTGAKATSLSTLLLTNAAKALGIYTFYVETNVRPTARESVLAVCVAFVFGAQATENALLRLIDRMFARD